MMRIILPLLSPKKFLVSLLAFFFLIIIGLSLVNQQVKAMTAAQCNQACRANADCDINLRCWHQRCRLAINPNNPNCRPQATSVPSHPIKTVPTTQTTNVSTTPVVEASPSTEATHTAVTKTKQHSASNAAQTTTQTTKKNNRSQLIVSVKISQTIKTIAHWIKNTISQPQYQLPLIIFLIGLGLTTFALLINRPKKTNITPVKPANVKLKEPHSMIQRVKRKQLKLPKTQTQLGKQIKA